MSFLNQTGASLSQRDGHISSIESLGPLSNIVDLTDVSKKKSKSKNMQQDKRLQVLVIPKKMIQQAQVAITPKLQPFQPIKATQGFST